MMTDTVQDRRFSGSPCLSTNKVTTSYRQTPGHRRAYARKRSTPGTSNAATVASGAAETHEETFRHAEWRRERERVRGQLSKVAGRGGRLDRFDACGSRCVVEWSPDRKRYRCKAHFCGDRFCVPCARSKAAKARKKLAVLIQGIEPLFITLTIKAKPGGLIQQLNHLLRSFARLRRSELWREKVSAGVFVIEVKRAAGTRYWFPHIHALCEGDFIEKWRLREEWRKATGDSFVVDIQRISDPVRAVRYVGKYVTKGWDHSITHSPTDLLECICSLRGRHLMASFGHWRGRDLEVCDAGPDDWKMIGTLNDIIDASHHDEPWAVAVMINLVNPVLGLKRTESEKCLE